MRKQEDERKKALEEQRQAEEEISKQEQEYRRIALEDARTSSLTEEVDLVMLTTPKGGTGVSAVPQEEDELAKAAREKTRESRPCSRKQWAASTSAILRISSSARATTP